ncbi:hypothetical protein G3A1_004 [Escherichia phage vB_EcoP-G3A1]|uniref:Uncharacterized protein n=1 Tax=Escherichia phage vB_EcoP-101117UKE2 TaxID=2865796 RepID=A0AAE8C4L4_9CAUD|nr:hypothetical protein 101117UKE2_004 [Escherichia phage vB_EcoP-101117UKE2]QZI79629.1 hypothetical protein 101118B1_004 [Escherichia phage vB_EcoP-101118B1]QZI81233.1 hypothetical protein G3A1_004 [Escherichia phage vB_EcoP-G3A1]
MPLVCPSSMSKRLVLRVIFSRLRIVKSPK